MKTALDILETITVKAGQWASLLFIPLMLIIIFDVVSRRFYTIGSVAIAEMEWHLHGVIFLCSIGFTYLKNAHVRVEIFHERMSKKGQYIIEILGCLFCLLPYSLIMIFFGIEFTTPAFLSNEISAAGEGLTHRWIMKAFIPFGFMLIGFAGIITLVKNIRLLKGDAK